MTKVRMNTSAHGTAAAFIEAAKGLPALPPHLTLRPRDMPFWEAIVSTKPIAEWNDTTLTVAAQLARLQADLTDWTRQAETQPPVLSIGVHAVPRINPLMTVINTATRRQLSLMVVLGIANKEDKREAGKRQAALRAARNVRQSLEANPLLAS